MFRKWRLWLFVIVYFAVSRPAGAQTGEGINLVTSPLPITLRAKPGQTVSSELRVKNNGATNETLQAKLLKFSADENGEIKLSEPQASDDYIKWASLSPTTFLAQPGEWKTVKLLIKLPDSAAFGYYYAVSFSRANQKPAPKTTSIEGQVVTFVLLEAISPNAKRQLEVTSFTADRSFYEFLPARLSITVKNTGNIHVAPIGNIFVKRGNKTVSTLTVNDSKGNILPNSSRTFEVDWDTGFPVYQKTLAANGQVGRRLDWDISKASSFRIGKYGAELVLVYDDGRRDVPIEGHVDFWVVPWRLIFGLLAIPLVPAVAVYWLMKRRYKNQPKAGR